MELRLSWASGRRGVILRARSWEGCWNLWFLGWLRRQDRSISFGMQRATRLQKEIHRADCTPMRRMLRCINGEVSSREVKPDDDQDIYHGCTAPG
jgi:hypothetical protein